MASSLAVAKVERYGEGTPRCKVMLDGGLLEDISQASWAKLESDVLGQLHSAMAIGCRFAWASAKAFASNLSPGTKALASRQVISFPQVKLLLANSCRPADAPQTEEWIRFGRRHCAGGMLLEHAGASSDCMLAQSTTSRDHAGFACCRLCRWVWRCASERRKSSPQEGWTQAEVESRDPGAAATPASCRSLRLWAR